ncbi:hypothetical protein ACLOJK_027470 [Asimina triloba]
MVMKEDIRELKEAALRRNMETRVMKKTLATVICILVAIICYLAIKYVGKEIEQYWKPQIGWNPGNNVRSHLSFRQELHNLNDFSKGFHLDINASCALLPSIACDRKPANGHDLACDLNEVAPSKTLRGIDS